jgi:large subunit ribosomal protein L35Ae
MNGLIVSHRRGMHVQMANQFLLKVEGVSDKLTASKLIGKTIVWTTPTKRELHGRISAVHGANGVMRVRFSDNMSGNVLGQKVEILE